MSSAEGSSRSPLCQKEVLYHGMLCIMAIAVVVAQVINPSSLSGRAQESKKELSSVSGDSSQLLHNRPLPGLHAPRE